MTKTGNCATKVSGNWQIASCTVETESFELKAQHQKPWNTPSLKTQSSSQCTPTLPNLELLLGNNNYSLALLSVSLVISFLAISRTH